MGRSAKITRCVGLRQMKNAKKGVVKTSAKDRRRREKAERVQAALEAAAEERRQSRKEQLKERGKADAKEAAGVAPNAKGFFSLGAAADALCAPASPRPSECPRPPNSAEPFRPLTPAVRAVD